MIKRELCKQHAYELRETPLFGGRPTEEQMPAGDNVACGTETMQLYGETTTKRVVTCNRNAEVRFVFGGIRPQETIIK